MAGSREVKRRAIQRGWRRRDDDVDRTVKFSVDPKLAVTYEGRRRRRRRIREMWNLLWYVYYYHYSFQRDYSVAFSSRSVLPFCSNSYFHPFHRHIKPNLFQDSSYSLYPHLHHHQRQTFLNILFLPTDELNKVPFSFPDFKLFALGEALESIDEENEEDDEEEEEPLRELSTVMKPYKPLGKKTDKKKSTTESDPSKPKVGRRRRPRKRKENEEERTQIAVADDNRILQLRNAKIQRNLRRKQMISDFYGHRLYYKRMMAEASTVNERLNWRSKLQGLPRDSCANRYRNRCPLTGRARGYYRFFGLGRHAIRKLMLEGQFPGFYKASW